MTSIFSKILEKKNTNEAKVGKQLNEREGTMAFVLSDIEWDNKNRIYEIFDIPTSWGGIYMKKNDANRLIFSIKSNKLGNQEIESSDLSKFQKASRHHIVITWSEKELNLYIDGKLNSLKKLIV